MASQHITDTGNKYFCIMPNMADDDLDPYQYRLYGHYKRVCGDGGSCWESTITTADKTKMSTGKVASTRRELAELGFITISEDGKTLSISIVDVMPQNVERYKNRSPHERSPHEPKKNPLKDSQEEQKDSVAQSATMENAASEASTTHEQQEPEPTPAKERELPKRTKRGKDKAYSEACSFRASLSEREQLAFDNLHFALMRVQYHLDKSEIDMTGNANHRRYQKNTYKIVHTLMTSGYDLNADTITAFGQWYSVTYPQATMVKAIDKTCEHIDQFLQEHTERQQRLEAQRQKAPPRTQSETLTPERRAQLKAEILGQQSTFDFGTATEQPHD